MVSVARYPVDSTVQLTTTWPVGPPDGAMSSGPSGSVLGGSGRVGESGVAGAPACGSSAPGPNGAAPAASEINAHAPPAMTSAARIPNTISGPAPRPRAGGSGGVCGGCGMARVDPHCGGAEEADHGGGGVGPAGHDGGGSGQDGGGCCADQGPEPAAGPPSGVPPDGYDAEPGAGPR